MSDFVLIRKSGLGLAELVIENWEGFSLLEMENEPKYWISVSGSSEKFNAAVKKTFLCELPENGRFAVGGTSTKPCRIAATGPGQWLLIGYSGKIPVAIKKLAAITDQSDGWVGWHLAGDKVRTVLEKLIGLDLHPSEFTGGSAARTSLEAMPAILLCEDTDAGQFVLYSQRSYARDFAERIRQAAYSACGEQVQVEQDGD
ncbi:MAG: hypothetical protein AAF362_15350 [Pseudomonadota bacterium]